MVLATASLASTSLLNTAGAATAEDLNTDSRQALQRLYKTNPYPRPSRTKPKPCLSSRKSSRRASYSAAAMVRVY
jgi:hypothetical protein